MRYYKGLHIAPVFEKILEDLWYDPDYVTSPRGMEVREILNCSIEIEDPMVNTFHHPLRSSPLKYIAAEVLWYFSRTNDPTYIENYASLWKNIHNEDGTVNSAYGYLIFADRNAHGFSQYQWVIESLKKDKDSRQAFMHFNKPKHQFLENKDQVCTLQALFHIRENKLHMTLTMRSNDVIYGFMTDWAFFSILHNHVFLELKKTYPELEMGSYTHISHSMHLYERHYDLVKEMVKNPIHERAIFHPGSTANLTDTVVDEKGLIKEEYNEVLLPIIRGEKPNYNNLRPTGNYLIDWCIEKLRE
jgi:thymidylate synthase